MKTSLSYLTIPCASPHAIMLHIFIKYIVSVNILMPVQILFPEICDIWVPEEQTSR